ncbi:MAG: spore coat associated protein CotJA [Eubacteriales bacterium]|nr:spore coat associated protein CotJA [Eubacteriales bacterium]
MEQNRYPDMHTTPDNACVPQETVIKDVQLACAYVPIQKLCSTFTPMKTLMAGTAFPELYDAYGWESEYGY